MGESTAVGMFKKNRKRAGSGIDTLFSLIPILEAR